MKQFRTAWTTEPNCSLHASCYWFDTEASPMMSKGGAGNRSNTVMIETPTRTADPSRLWISRPLIEF